MVAVEESEMDPKAVINLEAQTKGAFPDPDGERSHLAVGTRTFPYHLAVSCALGRRSLTLPEAQASGAGLAPGPCQATQGSWPSRSPATALKSGRLVNSNFANAVSK